MVWCLPEEKLSAASDFKTFYENISPADVSQVFATGAFLENCSFVGHPVHPFLLGLASEQKVYSVGAVADFKVPLEEFLIGNGIRVDSESTPSNKILYPDAKISEILPSLMGSQPNFKLEHNVDPTVWAARNIVDLAVFLELWSRIKYKVKPDPDVQRIDTGWNQFDPAGSFMSGFLKVPMIRNGSMIPKSGHQALVNMIFIVAGLQPQSVSLEN